MQEVRQKFKQDIDFIFQKILKKGLTSFFAFLLLVPDTVIRSGVRFLVFCLLIKKHSQRVERAGKKFFSFLLLQFSFIFSFFFSFSITIYILYIL